MDITSQETIIQQLEGEFKAYELTNPLNTVRYELLKNKFESEYQCIEGPTPALAALVAITVAICTQGLGASLGTSLVAAPGYAVVGSSAAMWNAGVASMCAKTAVSFLSNQGDFGRVIKDISSKQSLKNLVLNIASAGLTAGLADHLKMTTNFKGLGAADELVARLKLAGLREAVSGSCHMIINGENPSDLLRDSWKHIAVDVGGGFAAGKIGDWYNAGQSGAKIGYAEHKTLHMLVGAGIGGILSKDVLQGAITGAISALVTAVVTEIQTDSLYKNLKEDEEIDVQSYLDDMDKITMRSKIIAAVGATLMGHDPNIALKVSDNLVSNNCLPILAAIVVRAAAIQLLKMAAKEGAKKLAKEGGKKALKEAVKESVKKGIKEQGKKTTQKALTKKGAKQGKEHLKKYGKKVHGNSLDYKGDTHVYKIVKNGKIQKYGESTRPCLGKPPIFLVEV